MVISIDYVPKSCPFHLLSSVLFSYQSFIEVSAGRIPNDLRYVYTELQVIVFTNIFQCQFVSGNQFQRVFVTKRRGN